MTCCPDTKFSFFHQAQTLIPYTPTMRLQYGNYPKVEVLYWDGTNYVAQGVFTSIKLVGNPVNSIVIDHGDPYSQGIVKVN